MIEGLIQPHGLVPQQPGADTKTGTPKNPEPSSRMGRIRIRGRHHDVSNARNLDGIRARRCPSVSAARFESDVKGGTACVLTTLLRVLEGFNLGMQPASAMMPAFADDATLFDQNGSDNRIGGGLPATAAGEPQREPHEGEICQG
jgi:hypothetical protein